MAIKENNFMAFDGITVACMAHELHKNLSGSRISKIAQPETDELLLTIKSQKEISGCFYLPVPVFHCLSDPDQ